MPDFLGLGKLRSGNDTKTATAGSSPAKKDPNVPPPTPLERMLEHAGPIRNDGSDKFFGMENFGNTCYCNSVLQCLYNTPRFRENILTYPHRSTPEILVKALAGVPTRAPYKLVNGVAVKAGQPANQPKVVTPATQPGQKVEEKDSPEYKKKLALAVGPVMNMVYQNNTSYDMPESMFTSLKDVFEALVEQQNRFGVLSPVRFLEVLRRDNEMFRSAMHQDAHEFLNLVLNTVMESIEEHEKRLENDKKALSNNMNGTISQDENTAVSWPSILPLPTSQSPTKWLRDMFEGTLTSETRCLTCETTSHRDEPFLDLSVDLEQHSSVTSCLNRFSREEMLCERDKFHCDNCGGLQEAEKRMKIKRLPQILALHLKRFKYTEDLARLQKLFHKVVYPFHLRLFHTSDETEDPDRLYELYAVVVHIGGGPYHGHYVSIIKTQDRGWLLYDDEMVEPVDRSYIQNFFGSPTSLACAYVLFYRQTTEEEVLREQQMEGKRRASQDLPQEGVNKAAEQAAEVHRVYSADTTLSSLDTGQFASLDHAVTAPPFSPNGNIETPKSPYGILSPISQSKKEKAKEEKDRKAAEKAAEKERDKVEKQRKKDAEQQQKDAQKRQTEELKAISEANKQGKLEEDRKNGTPETTDTNGLASRDIFRRSKSFKFGSLGRRDKSALNTTLATDDSTQNSNPLSPTNSSTPISAIEEASETNGGDKDKEKKNRFSLRKKSFGILS